MTAALKRSLAVPHNLRLSQRSSQAACVGINASLRDLLLAAVLLRQRGGGGQVKSNKRTLARPSWMALLDPEQTFVPPRRFNRTDSQKPFTSYSPRCELPRRPIPDAARVTRLRVAAFRSLRKVGHSR